MKVLRKIIREALFEVFLEASPTTHYNDQIRARFNKYAPTTPEFNFDWISDNLNYIKKINFPKNESYAILIKKLGKKFVSDDGSNGDEVWVLIRENSITTIMLRRSAQTQRGVEIPGIENYIYSFDKLKEFYETQPKNEAGEVDYKKNEYNKFIAPKEKSSLLPTINLRNKEWYVDKENEKLIYKKDDRKQLSFYDLDDKEFEMLFSVV